jgi:hemolysin III
VARPRLRGWSHGLAFLFAVPAGVILGLEAHTARGRVAAIVYASSVVFMFGASGIYHRVTWRGPWRLRMRRVDHAGIFLLIAGSYTPFGLLVLHGALQIVVLATVWTGAIAAIALKVIWVDAPKWLAAAIAIPLGWVAVVVLPEIVHELGLTACLLVVAGGIAYTAGGLVYAFRRPDPIPTVFGYHELFHALVILAVGLQYGTIAFYVLPDH